MSIEILEINSRGLQGLQGLPGAPGSAVTLPAASVLSGHRLVTVDVDGRAILASADAAAHAIGVMGLTINAAVENEAVVLASFGIVEMGGWAWVPNLPIYLGLNGALTQSANVGLFAKIIGIAVTPTRLVLSFQPAIFH